MEKIAFVPRFSGENGSFELVDYDKNKAILQEYLDKIADNPLILTDEDCKAVRKTRTELNKAIELVSSGRKASVRLISAQFKEVEALIQDKADKLTKVINDYTSSKAVEDGTPKEEKKLTLTIKGYEKELSQVLIYAKSLGLEGGIK